MSAMLGGQKVDDEEPLLANESVESSRNYGDQKQQTVSDITGTFESKPWAAKAVALLCSCLLSVGSHYASAMLNAYEDVLVENMGITARQFGLLQSSVSLINTIVPLFGGLFIDRFGTIWGSIVASTLIMVGEVVVAVSAELNSFPVMVCGRVLYGVGAGTIVTVQEAILAHWFRGRGFTFAVGLQIGISRLTNWVAVVTVNPIEAHFNDYAIAFWISSAVCIISWLINLLYVWLLHYLKEVDAEKIIREKLKKKNLFSMEALTRFPTIFWVVTFLSFATGSAWGPFNHVSADLIKFRFNRDATEAAWVSSVSLVLPIVISPILGMIIDRHGKRGWTALFAAVCLAVGFIFSGFTCVDPAVGQLIFSLSLACGPIPQISSLGLVVPLSAIGTALGVYKCATNIGSTIMDLLVGYMKDHFAGYNHAMALLMIAAGLSIMGSLAMILIDFLQLHGLLNADSTRRREIQERTPLKAAQESISESPRPSISWLYISITIVLVVISWTMYIFVLVGSTQGGEDGGVPTGAPTQPPPVSENELICYDPNAPTPTPTLAW